MNLEPQNDWHGEVLPEHHSSRTVQISRECSKKYGLLTIAYFPFSREEKNLQCSTLDTKQTLFCSTVYPTISINCLHLQSYPSSAYCQQLPATTSPSHTSQHLPKLEYLLMMVSSPTTVTKGNFLLTRVLGPK